MRRDFLLMTIAANFAMLLLAGCNGGSYGGGGNPVAPSISMQPTNQTVTVGHTATFSVTATGTAPLYYQWRRNSSNISGAAGPSYTTPATTTTDNGTKFDVVVNNSAGNVTSNAATLTVTASTSGGSTDVVTHHYDVSRSGVNSTETVLTTSNVNSTTFGKVGEFAVDGQIDGQALFLSQLAIPGQGNKDVLYVATENDSVYAVDAQSISGSSVTILWKPRFCCQENLQPIPEACRAATSVQMGSRQRRSSIAPATPSTWRLCPRIPQETSSIVCMPWT